MLATRNHEPQAKKQRASPGPKVARSEPQQLNPIWQQLATRIQTNVQVSAPDDPYEREADHVADRVMHGSPPVVQRSCAACAAGSATCPQCEEEQRGARPFIQRKAQDGSDEAGSSAPDRLLDSLGSGYPLDRATRNFMESRFGRSFGDVRVHADAPAAEAAAAFSARAFTLGRDVVFDTGQYAPNTDRGQRLLAHELTHVIQQSDGSTVNSGNGSLRANAHAAGAKLQRQPSCSPDHPEYCVSTGAAGGTDENIAPARDAYDKIRSQSDDSDLKDTKKFLEHAGIPTSLSGLAEGLG